LSMQSKVTLIIPVHNSAATIKDTLESVIGQTFGGWEAVIVDDGSSDETEEIVRNYLNKDKRIRFIKQQKSGVSAARNTGIENALNDWLLFLDADDLIKPEMLEKMIKAARLHPECDLILCNWERLTVDGKTIMEIGPDWKDVDAFNLFAFTCAFCIHSCLVKKLAVLKVGKFDQSLITCEDWDLWQRIARTGAKFTLIPDYLAVYRMRSASASNKGIQLFKDGLIVVSRGHSKDPRVFNPDEKYINGTSAPDLRKAIFGLFTWSAGLMFGSGDNPLRLLEHLPKIELHFINVTGFANEFFRAAILPTGRSFEVWEELYNKNFEVLKSFLKKVEDLTFMPEFVNRCLISFERIFLNEVNFSSPKILGTTLGIPLDITREINHLFTEKHIEKVIIKITAEEKVLGNIELPVINGFIHKYVIKDAAAENYGWRILGEFFKENIYRNLTLKRLIVLKLIMKLHKKDIRKYSINYFEKLHDFIGWAIFLQECFNRPLWTTKRFYLPFRQLKFVRTVVQNTDPLIIEIGNEIPNLKLIKQDLILIITAGGNACAKISISTRKKFLHAQELRSIIIKELGYELCRMVVREILLEKELKEKISLIERMRDIYRETVLKASPGRGAADSCSNSYEIKKIISSREKTLIIPRRNSQFQDDSSARFASLPIETFINSIGQKVKYMTNKAEMEISPDSKNYDYLIYSPNVITAGGDNPLLVKDLRVYEPKKYRIKFPAHAWELPILMYHRIAPSGSDLTKPYRITPSEFEKQMQYLHGEGYRTVSFEAWYAAVKLNKPLPGKTIILTFDDGYLDFYQYAFPVLEKYKLGAYVFIVTDNVGQFNEWDQRLGEKVPLMNWGQIAELNNEGIGFGSHGSNHRPLTALNSEQLACQFLNSLNALRKNLGTTINSIAYPYGDYDPVVKHIAGACGYTFALTCDNGKCGKYSQLLALPRIEISGSDSLESFIRKVEKYLSIRN